MKKLMVLTALMSSSVFAIDGMGLYNGLKYKTLKTSKVKSSKWLEKAASKLETEYDFHENVSYVGEDWEDVMDFCGFDEETGELVYENSTVEAFIDWNKVVTRKRNKTKAYALYLFANISSSYGDCMYPRGTYAVDKKGSEIDTYEFYEETGIDLGAVLDGHYKKNNPTEVW